MKTSGAPNPYMCILLHSLALRVTILVKMRKFLASAGFPFLMALVMGGAAVAAYALLQPTGEDVGNSQIVQAFTYAGWAVGPVIFLLSFLLICILNLLRRIFRLRKLRLLHPIIVLLGIVPWLVFSWVLLDEPRYTAFARATIDFVARPMLWGSLMATLLTILLSIPLFFSASKKKQ